MYRAWVVAAVVLVAAWAASSARAQDIVYGSVSYPATPVVVSYGYSVAQVGGWSAGPPFNPRFSYYSYHVTAPNVARGYVPYGALDSFPFYGQPYGRAYDAWTWDAMSGPLANRPLFYYPPVR